jgi:hypothetical protein
LLHLLGSFLDFIFSKSLANTGTITTTTNFWMLFTTWQAASREPICSSCGATDGHDAVQIRLSKGVFQKCATWQAFDLTKWCVFSSRGLAL